MDNPTVSDSTSPPIPSEQNELPSLLDMMEEAADEVLHPPIDAKHATVLYLQEITRLPFILQVFFKCQSIPTFYDSPSRDQHQNDPEGLVQEKYNPLKTAREMEDRFEPTNQQSWSLFDFQTEYTEYFESVGQVALTNMFEKIFQQVHKNVAEGSTDSINAVEDEDKSEVKISWDWTNQNGLLLSELPQPGDSVRVMESSPVPGSLQYGRQSIDLFHHFDLLRHGMHDDYGILSITVHPAASLSIPTLDDPDRRRMFRLSDVPSSTGNFTRGNSPNH